MSPREGVPNLRQSKLNWTDDHMAKVATVAEQMRRRAEKAEAAADLLRDDLDAAVLRAEHAERERDEISGSLEKMDEKWRHAYNRLRDYEDRGGDA